MHNFPNLQYPGSRMSSASKLQTITQSDDQLNCVIVTNKRMCVQFGLDSTEYGHVFRI